ncbi:anthranilate synthase family protein [Lipingzhangella sp. LS1_29]|uniref:anthranilate synthase n=1 Tax=Lipingzhangella rawalii TaxID=2055835 RepID=A0ABU2H679_9ACTN|nr:anthranilate synthase family protein [Lipingzhangella rawalii]MDS1270783.1 anthranilate synthase family protein [Lipingzhangella rawalii]
MTTPTHALRPADLLDRVLSGESPSFALLYRPDSKPGSTAVEVVSGEVCTPERLADLPLPETDTPEGAERHDLLAVVPYRQIGERGFAHVDDGAPLYALKVREQQEVPCSDLLDRVPDTGIVISQGCFDIDDATYADTASRIISTEIGQGEGANFVLKRSFRAQIDGYGPQSALTLFRRLLEQESGTYWTFVVHTPERTFVGATPERHVSLRDGVAVMNPISGTYRYPPSGPDLDEVMDFLQDGKEADELYMVVDEELKMMARVCDSAPRVVGPRLKEMARLAHTEYIIEGDTSRDPREILRETMFAPTVTGSPLENAARVIARHEPEGRGHYSGALTLIGRDPSGTPTLDSAILIRTADIDPVGHTRISVGATLVRHSQPECEVAETHAKAAGLINALEADQPRGLAEHGQVQEALTERNSRISGFWLDSAHGPADPELQGLDVLVIDAEDTFTAMLAHQIRSLGPSVEVRRFDEPCLLTGRDLVLLGPGPGDPRDGTHPKIAKLRSAVRTLVAEDRPFLAVCLSHQILSRELALQLIRRDLPNQGVQHQIDLFGHSERVGFYNTFAASCAEDKVEGFRPEAGPVEVSRDTETCEVHALRGPRFTSLQFHPESVLTCNGPAILARTMKDVLNHSPAGGAVPTAGLF